MFYISCLTLDAAGFAQRSRQHWHLEKRLHWVKDVVLQEELAPLCDGHAPVNFALVRTMALNLFRHHGLDSITQGLRRLAHDIPTLFPFFNRSALLIVLRVMFEPMNLQQQRCLVEMLYCRPGQ